MVRAQSWKRKINPGRRKRKRGSKKRSRQNPTSKRQKKGGFGKESYCKNCNKRPTRLNERKNCCENGYKSCGSTSSGGKIKRHCKFSYPDCSFIPQNERTCR